MPTTPGQTSPPIPTRSPIADSTGLVTRTWINWFTFLSDLFITAVSPTLTGVPTAPTAAPGTNNTQIASTAYADAAVEEETMRAESAESSLLASIAAETNRAESAEALLAPLASPHLTGSPLAPTAPIGTNTTQISSTAFVSTAVSVETARAEAAESLKAPLASPALTGSPIAPTAATGTGTAQIATTAFVLNELASPPSIGSTTPAAGAFTNVSVTGSITGTQTATFTGYNSSITGVAASGFRCTQRSGSFTLTITAAMTQNILGAINFPTAAPSNIVCSFTNMQGMNNGYFAQATPYSNNSVTIYYAAFLPAGTYQFSYICS